MIRSAVRIALRALPLGLLAVVVWRERLWTVRLPAGAAWAFAAAILLNFAVSLPLKAARWRIALTPAPRFRAALAATLEGLLANAALGFGSGDLVRSARLRRDVAVDYARTWAERGAEVLALGILISVTALVTNLGTSARVWALVVAGGTAAAYVALLGAGRVVVRKLSRWPRAHEILSAALRASTPRRVAAIAALTLAGWACEAGMLVIFQRTFHLDPSWRTALLTLAGINAAIVIPTLPGNFGTFEAGAAIALVLAGAPREVAISYAFAYHLAHVIPVAAVAAAVAAVRSARAADPETAR